MSSLVVAVSDKYMPACMVLHGCVLPTPTSVVTCPLAFKRCTEISDEEFERPSDGGVDRPGDDGCGNPSRCFVALPDRSRIAISSEQYKNFKVIYKAIQNYTSINV